LGKDCNDLWTIQRNLGQNFYWARDFENSEKYLLQSLQNLQKLPLEKSLKTKRFISINSYLSKLYIDWNKPNMIAQSHERQLELALQLGNKMTLAGTYEEIGDYLSRTKATDKALAHFRKALDLYQEIGHQRGVASVLNSFGELYLTTNDYTRAKQYAEQTITICNQKKYINLLPFAYKTLMVANDKLGDELSALRTLKLLNHLQDSMGTGKRLIDLADIRRVYEVDKTKLETEKLKLQQQSQMLALQRQLEIDRIKAENERNQLLQEAKMIDLQANIKTETTQKEAAIIKLSTQKRLRNYQLIGLLLLGILGTWLAWYAYTLKQKNAELARKKREIEEAYFRGQSTERKRVATELHDNLGGLLSAAKMSLQILDPSQLHWREREIYENTVGMMITACKELRSLSHNMLPEVLEQEGLAEALSHIIEKYNQASSTFFALSMPGLSTTRFLPEVEFNLYLICSELCNNILKHSQATAASLEFLNIKNQLLIRVFDNGLGIKNSTIDRNEGMGLANVCQRIKDLNGTIEIQSPQPTGTLILIHIPLSSLNKIPAFDTPMMA
jgi:signal transduction histidine kinase